jgi:hypothetical protein
MGNIFSDAKDIVFWGFFIIVGIILAVLTMYLCSFLPNAKVAPLVGLIVFLMVLVWGYGSKKQAETSYGADSWLCSMTGLVGNKFISGCEDTPWWCLGPLSTLSENCRPHNAECKSIVDAQNEAQV